MKKLIISFLFAFALIGLCYAQSTDDAQFTEINLLTDDEAVYPEPGYKWGLYFDIKTIGATYFDLGMGVSFFNDNVRIQGQFGMAPSEGLLNGYVLGTKFMANIFYLPFEWLFGPGWGFYSMNLALGANFSCFLMDDGGPPMYMGAFLAQWDIANIDFEFFFPGWKYFSRYALYLQPEIWFASSDIGAPMTILRMSIGLRLNMFMNESKICIRPSNKIDYSAPGFVQGMYFDGMVLGAFNWSAGVGLTFFDDNVKFQMQVAHAPSGRFSGLAFGGKILGNVWAQNLEQWFGPDWAFLKTSVALGANFSYFLMEEGEDPLWMGQFLSQWEIVKIDMGFFMPEWKYFKSFSIYVEPGIWFSPSDVNYETSDSNAWRTRLTIGVGARVSLF